ncbi:MAG: hypothetical protein J6A41_03010 [Ruminiclostridium sp.]|nr:hypothetical protein [Ruminiclostridium sp.]
MKLFHSKKSKIALAVEIIIPWLILIGSIPAIYWWFESDRQWRMEYNSEAYIHAESMFNIFYSVAMSIGVIALTAEAITFIVSLIMMIISVVRKTKCLTFKMLIFVACAFLGVMGAEILMVLTHVFTYGMGI